MRMSDVSCGICVEPELLPVVMSTDAVELLAVPVVALTRSQVDEPLVVARPVNVDAISRAAVYPDLLSGRVMKSVDPDVRSGDPMSLKTIPGADGDACHSSAAEPTFLPALSEVYSPVFLTGGGGGVVAAANPLAVVESDTARVSVLPVDSDTARVSALPVDGIEVPAVYFGKVALDSVGLRVGLSCFRLDPEETLPASLDERGVTSDVDLGVTPDGGPVEGGASSETVRAFGSGKVPDGGFTEVPVLESLEPSVLGDTPDGGPMVGAPVLESIEHSVPEKALDDRPMAGIAVMDPLEHSVLDVDMDYLWMAPMDAGGTFRIGPRPEVAIHKNKFHCVIQLSCRPAFPAAGYLGCFGGLAKTCVIDLYAGVSTTPVEMMVEDKKPDFLELASKDSRGRGYGYSPGGSCKIDLGFPRASCTPVEMCAVDSNFPRATFPSGELCVERQDYIRRASLTGSPVCTRTVTGSLLFRSPNRLVRGSSCSMLFLPRWTDELEDIPGTLAIVLFYCLVVARFMLSDVSSTMEQASPSSASSARLKERIYAFH